MVNSSITIWGLTGGYIKLTSNPRNLDAGWRFRQRSAQAAAGSDTKGVLAEILLCGVWVQGL